MKSIESDLPKLSFKEKSAKVLELTQDWHFTQEEILERRFNL